METIHERDLEQIKKYGFAILPTRMVKASAEKKEEHKLSEALYSVQCQFCGRIGLMSQEEMEQHQKSHKGPNKDAE